MAQTYDAGSIKVLEGLDADATYTVTDIDTGTSLEKDGKTLTEQGLEIVISERRASKILIYQRKA